VAIRFSRTISSRLKGGGKEKGGYSEDVRKGIRGVIITRTPFPHGIARKGKLLYNKNPYAL